MLITSFLVSTRHESQTAFIKRRKMKGRCPCGATCDKRPPLSHLAKQHFSKVISSGAKSQVRSTTVEVSAVHKVCDFFFRINFSGLLKAEAQFPEVSIWRFSINVKGSHLLTNAYRRETACVNICASQQFDRLCLCCPAAVKQLYSD